MGHATTLTASASSAWASDHDYCAALRQPLTSRECGALRDAGLSSEDAGALADMLTVAQSGWPVDVVADVLGWAAVPDAGEWLAECETWSADFACAPPSDELLTVASSLSAHGLTPSDWRTTVREAVFAGVGLGSHTRLGRSRSRADDDLRARVSASDTHALARLCAATATDAVGGIEARGYTLQTMGELDGKAELRTWQLPAGDTLLTADDVWDLAVLWLRRRARLLALTERLTALGACTACDGAGVVAGRDEWLDCDECDGSGAAK